MFHENRLTADDSHETSYLIFFFFLGGGEGLGKLFQNLSSAAVVIGALGTKILFPLNKEEINYPFHKLQSFQPLKHLQKLRLKMSSVEVARCIYLLTLLTNVLSCQPRVTVSSCYYQGLIIDRPLVYLSYPQDVINTQVIYRFALAHVESTI